MSERRILLVEDDHDLADMMSWVLTSAGFHVTTARDGAAGLQALERLPHSIVILDLVMPDVDGIEFRRRQQNHPIARPPARRGGAGARGVAPAPRREARGRHGRGGIPAQAFHP